ncbi:hypothetical protein IQ254_25460 [Nodosilinea sp. LEGE 07088]|uniref:hypothetical protein n=1 Tax=Nodosilinea sp. LEGE 07088 TaxID=2777968 RepID=UPI00187F2A09|nr:hypothetical protein [Nodosilinea sp. LEGE 07088]MBE9140506.1 hypothetical protein [Nodosilinea sp. LEGE 07088]
MKRSVLMLLGLITLGIALDRHPAIAELPQDSTIAQFVLIDAAAPVGTLDPAKPIQIRVVNRSGQDTVVGAVLLQPPTDTRFANPGEVVTFGTLHTSFLPPPLELEVSAKDADISVEAVTILVRDNEIILSAEAQPGPADTTRVVRVDESGEVFLF